MIFLNQVKDTRYVVQINFFHDLMFKINVKVIFKFHDNGNIKVPIKSECKFIDSITVNGLKRIFSVTEENEILIEADKLNNNSENIIVFTLKGESNTDLIVISNTFKELENLFNHLNVLILKLPLFDFYTSNSKYRLFITIPNRWEIYNKHEPFQISHEGDNKTICFQSNEPNAIQNLNLSIKSDKIEWKHINEYFYLRKAKG